MNGILRALWMVSECPHCHAPNVTNKPIVNDAVLLPLEPKYIHCENCEQGYFVQIKELEYELRDE